MPTMFKTLTFFSGLFCLTNSDLKVPCVVFESIGTEKISLAIVSAFPIHSFIYGTHLESIFIFLVLPVLPCLSPSGRGIRVDMFAASVFFNLIYFQHVATCFFQAALKTLHGGLHAVM